MTWQKHRGLLVLITLFFTSTGSWAQQLVFSENFNSAHHTSLPANWTYQLINGSTSLDSFHFTDTLYYFPPPLEEPYALFDAYSGGSSTGTNGNGLGEEVAILSPYISTQSRKNLFLHFDYFLVNFSSASIHIDVSSNGGSWVSVWTFNGITNDVASQSLNMSSYINVDSLRFRLRWKNTSTALNQGYGLFDNIKLVERDSTDIAVEGISQPVSNNCATADQEIAVQLKNTGIKAVLNVPIQLKLTGVTNTVLYDTIAYLAPQSATSLSLGYVNTSGGGTLHVQAISNLIGDGYHANDTFTSSFIISALGSTPSVSDAERCGNGSATLSSSAQAAELSMWFKDSNAGPLLDTGISFTTPYLSTTTTYYVQNAITHNKQWSSYQGPWRYNGNPTGGTYFNLTARNDVLIDSIFQLCAYASTNTVVTVYSRKGVYQGYEQQPAAWQVLSRDTLNTLGWGKYIAVDVKDLMIYSGETYAFYISVQGAASPTFKQQNLTVSAEDFTLSSNTINNLQFGATINGYAWNGKVGYKRLCESNRIACTAVIHHLPAGVELKDSTPFQGRYKAGTLLSPDVVSEQDTISYTLNPPDNYSWIDFGDSWNVNDIIIQSINGTAIPSQDTILISPSGSNGGVLRYVPGIGWEDSTIVIKISVMTTEHFCDTVLSRIVYVAPSPQAAFKADPVCLGNITRFVNESTISKGSLSYKWYFGNGDSSDLANPVLLYKQYGIYPVKLVVSSSQGIVHDTTINVEVYEIPEVKFKAINACEGVPLRFVNNSTANSGVMSYEWSFGDGGSSNDEHPSHLYSEANAYTVKLTASLNGCKSDATATAYQFPKPLASFNVEGECQFEPLRFTNTSTIKGKEPIGSLWEYGDGSLKATGNAVYHAYQLPGVVDVRLIAQSQFGCNDTAVQSIQIKESPEAAFRVENPCDQSPVVFKNDSKTPNQAATSYSWYFGDSDSSTQSDPIHQYSEKGEYRITLKARLNNGCKSELSRDIIIESQPVAAFELDGSCSGEEIQFINRTSNTFGSIQFKWKFGDGDSSSLYSPNHMYTVNTTTVYNVVLEASSTNGCSSTASKALEVGAKPVCSFSYEQSKTDRQVFSFTPDVLDYPSYTWLFVGDATSFETSPTHRFTYSDWEYEVKLFTTSDNGCVCGDSSVMIYTSWAVGVDELQHNLALAVYPNPADKIVYIQFAEHTESVEVVLLNTASQLVKSFGKLKLTENQAQIDVSDLASGIYYLNVKTEKGLAIKVLRVQH